MKYQLNESSKARSVLSPALKTSSLATPTRPPSSLAARRNKSPAPFPGGSSSPKKSRALTFDAPLSSPSKNTPSLQLPTEDAEDTLGPNHLVDATIVEDLDLSADFDVSEISRMLADERARENHSAFEPQDKVLVSVR
jgi:hypothetical protein